MAVAGKCVRPRVRWCAHCPAVRWPSARGPATQRTSTSGAWRAGSRRLSLCFSVLRLLYTRVYTLPQRTINGRVGAVCLCLCVCACVSVSVCASVHGSKRRPQHPFQITSRNGRPSFSTAAPRCTSSRSLPAAFFFVALSPYGALCG